MVKIHCVQSQIVLHSFRQLEAGKNCALDGARVGTFLSLLMILLHLTTPKQPVIPESNNQI